MVHGARETGKVRSGVEVVAMGVVLGRWFRWQRSRGERGEGVGWEEESGDEEETWDEVSGNWGACEVRGNAS